MDDTTALRPLIAHLAAHPPTADGWQEWQIRPVRGGSNNLLYRATRPGGDYAIKFTRADARDRAGREWDALRLLTAAGCDLAPQAVLLLRDEGLYPVVVQTWLDGSVRVEPPGDDAEWTQLVGHFVAIHALTPSDALLPLRSAVLTMHSAAEGITHIQEQVATLPSEAPPPALQAVVRRAGATAFPTWPAPALTLCRCDPNTRNLVRRSPAWASVDWENSGWGDPAFELGDLMAHPTYAAVPAARWDWLLNHYARLTGDEAVAERAQVYYRLTVVWWVARFIRAGYEVPRDLDTRLVAPPTDWVGENTAQTARYLDQAWAVRG